jgi:hypothetical protein
MDPSMRIKTEPNTQASQAVRIAAAEAPTIHTRSISSGLGETAVGHELKIFRTN